MYFIYDKFKKEIMMVFVFMVKLYPTVLMVIRKTYSDMKFN